MVKLTNGYVAYKIIVYGKGTYIYISVRFERPKDNLHIPVCVHIINSKSMPFIFFSPSCAYNYIIIRLIVSPM